MSTSVLYPNTSETWKQEVHQRLNAHRSRRGSFAVQPAAPPPGWSAGSGRGSQVAARVAARYAHAPSYSQLQCIDAPVAPRVALPPVAAAALPAAPKPVVAQPAPEAPRAAVPVLQVAPPASRSWEPEVKPTKVSVPHSGLASTLVQANVPPPPPESLDAWESEYSQIGWQPDPRLRPVESDWVRSPRPAQMDEFLTSQALEMVEPDLPIPANLIEFPREVVAPRKMRPRRAERFAAEGMDRQLSIFEVDPGIYSAPVLAEAEPAPSIWTQPEWSGIKLEAQPQEDAGHEEPAQPQADVHLAPIGHRLMSVLVDGALVTAAFIVLAVIAAASLGAFPDPKTVAIGAGAGILILGLLYQALFLLLAEATPGMKYAGISLCTFDGQIPSAAELRSRLGALLFSVVPVGLGLAWALFDEDHLCWHDRLSRTYLRKE